VTSRSIATSKLRVEVHEVTQQLGGRGESRWLLAVAVFQFLDAPVSEIHSCLLPKHGGRLAPRPAGALAVATCAACWLGLFSRLELRAQTVLYF